MEVVEMKDLEEEEEEASARGEEAGVVITQGKEDGLAESDFVRSGPHSESSLEAHGPVTPSTTRRLSQARRPPSAHC